MPCNKSSHGGIHTWPDTGDLFICRCETLCGYCCFDEARHNTDDAPGYVTLRQHVKASHLKKLSHTAVRLEPGYRGRVANKRCPCEVRALGKGKRAKEDDQNGLPGSLNTSSAPSTVVTATLGRKRGRDKPDFEIFNDNTSISSRRQDENEEEHHANEDASAYQATWVSDGTKSSKRRMICSSMLTSVQAQDNGSFDRERQPVSPSKSAPTGQCHPNGHTGHTGDSTPLPRVSEPIPVSNGCLDPELTVQSLADGDEQFTQYLQDAELQSESDDVSMSGAEQRSHAGGVGGEENLAGLVFLQGHLSAMVEWASNYGQQSTVARLLRDAAGVLEGAPVLSSSEED